MGIKSVKRNSERETAMVEQCQACLFDRVGGRQTPSPSSSGGGGYQNICTVLNFEPGAAEKKRDPRLEEFSQMGLQRVWLEVAEEIGVDAMLKMWRILDRDQASVGDDGRLLVPIRSYSTFLRFQRNRYIESLNGTGMKPRDIQKKLKDQLCEQISLRHISRLINQE
ncbi:MAG: hypothetical protein WC208_09685 [Gallionella sp.]|jgi:hypothetical protein